MSTGISGTGEERTQYVHTPGLPVTHSPGFVSCSLLIHVSLSEGNTILCGSLRLRLFPSSLYYSPPLVVVIS